MVTTIEVIDTAVKVGLGAIISGAAAYWVARLNHVKGIEKDKLQRRRELLESVAEQAEKFTQNALRYWAVLSDDTKRSEANSDLLESFRELTSAESKLLLLGEQNCQKLLREYGEYVKTFREEFISEGKKISEEQQREIRLNILDKRAALFNSLSAVYK